MKRSCRCPIEVAPRHKNDAHLFLKKQTQAQNIQKDNIWYVTIRIVHCYLSIAYFTSNYKLYLT